MEEKTRVIQLKKWEHLLYSPFYQLQPQETEKTPGFRTQNFRTL